MLSVSEPRGTMRGNTENSSSATESKTRRTSGRRVPLSALRDRKSTRLNSSHQIISYAVFCLKKKKCNNNRTRVINLYIHLGCPHRTQLPGQKSVGMLNAMMTIMRTKRPRVTLDGTHHRPHAR